MSSFVKTAISDSSTRHKSGVGRTTGAIGGLAFDWIMVGLSTLFIGGLYLDGWAHNHGRVDQSFFTVWHAFFYAGFGLVSLCLTGTLLFNRRQGYAWRTALPAGYSLSLLGVIIFALGGVVDLVWHELFGIEEDFDALLSPSHLALGLGLALIVSGPLRAAWQRTGVKPTWQALTPALLSLTCLTCALTFFMMFSHPLMSNIGGADHRHFNSEIGQVAGVVSILLMTGLVVGPAYLALRRWTLPPGSLTLVWGINATAMAIVDWHHAYTIVLLGAMIVLGQSDAWWQQTVGFVAVVLGAANVFGGFVVTDRMLEMFKRRPGAGAGAGGKR